MKDPIMEDLNKVIKDKELLPNFLRMNDVDEMYDLCQESNSGEAVYYSKEEFEEKIRQLVESLSDQSDSDSEW